MRRFLIPTVLALYSAVPHLLTGADFWSHPLGDHTKHLWSFWHTYDVVVGASWPWTGFLNAPTGGFLWDIMLGPSLLLLPVTAFFGPVVSCHIWIWGARFLTMFLQYRAAVLLGAKAAPACVGAILLGTAPYLLGYPIVSGVYERLSIWIVPLIVCSVFWFEQRGLRPLVWLATGFFLLSTSCAPYAYYAGLILLYLECSKWRLWKERWSLWIVLAIPLAAAFYSGYLSQSEWSLAPQPDRFVWGFAPVYESTTLSSLFLPHYSAQINGVDSGDWLLRLSYVGWVPTLCAGVMLFRRSPLKWSFAQRLICLGVLFLLLSLGPSVGSVPNVLFWLCSFVFPLYGSIPDPFQQIGIAAPMLLFAFALICSQHTKLLVPLTFIAFGELYLSLPEDVWQKQHPPQNDIYEDVQQGAVVDIPRQYRRREIASSVSFAGQLQHKQPIPFSVYAGVTSWDSYAPVVVGESQNWRESLKCLAKSGFRWLVLHKDHYVSTAAARTQIQKISEIIEPSRSTERAVLYDLSRIGEEVKPIRLLPFQPESSRWRISMPQQDPPSKQGLFSNKQFKCPNGG